MADHVKKVDRNKSLIGISSFVLALGIPLLIDLHFYWKVVCLYLGFAGFGYWIIARKMHTLVARGGTALAYAAIIAVASYFYVFTPASMTLYVEAKVPNYGEGSVYEGITWQSYFSQLNFRISNSGSVDYLHLYAKISTDLVIYALRQSSGSDGCQVSMEHPTTAPAVQTMVDGKPVGPVGIGETTTQPKKYYAVTPIYPNGTVGPPLGTDITYIVTCNRLSPGAEVDFIGALRVINKFPAKYLGDPPRPAKWVTMDVTFDADGRSRHLLFSHCENNKTCSVTTRL